MYCCLVEALIYAFFLGHVNRSISAHLPEFIGDYGLQFSRLRILYPYLSAALASKLLHDGVS